MGYYKGLLNSIFFLTSMLNEARWVGQYDRSLEEVFHRLVKNPQPIVYNERGQHMVAPVTLHKVVVLVVADASAARKELQVEEVLCPVLDVLCHVGRRGSGCP
jgi:hypothetical protein